MSNTTTFYNSIGVGAPATSEKLEIAGNIKASGVVMGAKNVRYVDLTGGDVATASTDEVVVISASKTDQSTRLVIHPMSGAPMTVSKTIYVMNASANKARVGCQYSPTPYYADWNGNGAWAGYTDVPPNTTLKVFVYANPTHPAKDVVSCVATLKGARPTRVDARSFGAIGYGYSDDTEAIRNALNFASPGGVVYLPAGVYKITGTLPIPDNVSIVGDGIQKTIIRPLFTTHFDGVFVAKNMYDNYPVGTKTTGFINISIEELTVDIFANHVNPKNNVALPTYTYSNGCFWFYPPAQPNNADFIAMLKDDARRCKNLTLKNIEVIGGPYYYENVVYTDRFGRQANGNWNINLGGIDGLYISGCTFRGAGRDTLNIKCCNSVFITNNTILDSEDDSIAIGELDESNWYRNPNQNGNEAVYTFDGSVGAYDAVISGNVIKQGATYGVKIFYQSRLIISNNIFHDMNLAAITSERHNCDHIVISNNTGVRIGNYALSVLNLPSGSTFPFMTIIHDTHTVSHLTITNNTVTTASNILANQNSSNVRYAVIAGNVIEGSSLTVNGGSGSYAKYIEASNVNDAT